MRANSLNDRKNLRKIKMEIAEKWKPNTTARHLLAIRNFLYFMEETRGWKLTDTTFLKYRQERHKKVVYLSPEQVEMIRSVRIVGNTSLRHRALFEVLLYTGCRISEALAIKRQDINWDTGEVEVLGKGGKYRMVLLGDSKEWVQKMLNTRADTRDEIFITQKEHTWHRVSAGRAIRELGKKAGLEFTLKPHIMRKTCLTYMLWSGTDLQSVREYAGHANFETTFHHYIAVDKNRIRQAHEYMRDRLKTKQMSLI